MVIKTRLRKVSYLLVLVLVVTVSVVAGCQSQQPAPSSPGQQGTQKAETAFISIGTATTGGVGYIIGSGMAQIIEKYVPNVKVNVEATSGSAENIPAVSTGKMEIGYSTASLLYDSYHGQGPLAGQGDFSNLRLIFSGHIGAVHLAVREDSGINSIEQLKGKKVAVGVPAIAGPAKAVLAAYGVKEGDYTPIESSATEIADALQDGTIDAGFWVMGVPFAALTSLANSVDVKLLGLTEEKAKEITGQHPYWTTMVIPANSYRGQEKDVLALAEGYPWFTNVDVSEDLIYEITKAIYEHTDELAAVHPSGKEYTLENALRFQVIPLHSGTEKYLKEKGVLK